MQAMQKQGPLSQALPLLNSLPASLPSHPWVASCIDRHLQGCSSHDPNVKWPLYFPLPVPGAELLLPCCPRSPGSEGGGWDMQPLTLLPRPSLVPSFSQHQMGSSPVLQGRGSLCSLHDGLTHRSSHFAPDTETGSPRKADSLLPLHNQALETDC